MPIDGVLTRQEWSDLVISVAALRGAIVDVKDMRLLPDEDRVINYYTVSGAGYFYTSFSLSGACRDWLADVGIHVSSGGEIVDLSTRVEDTPEGNDAAE